MRVWYTSDLHLGHRFVSELRGYATTEEHNAEIFSEWNRIVHADDVVFVLGDVALGSVRDGLAALAEMPGRKRLIAGNHDRCHPGHREAHKWTEVYAHTFEFVAPFHRRRVEGYNFLMSHYPYVVDRGGEPRDMQYRLPDLGLPLLHGHTHSGGVITSDSEYHVGWDAHRTLVPESAVIRWLGAMSPSESPVIQTVVRESARRSS